MSVIVPVYNTEPYLRRCLDSILAQTERRIEVVVVDDGSPDGCPAICDEYAERDARVRVVHQANGGRSAARNAGLAAASGRWIGFVDSDDWIEPDMYALLLDVTGRTGADIAVCGRVEERPDGSTEIAYTGHDVLATEQALAELIRDVEVRSYLWDKLVRRELFEGIEFPVGRNYEDVAVVYRLFQRAKVIGFANKALCHYVLHGDNIVMNEALANRVDYWCAAKQRYDELAPMFPDLKRELECDVMRVNLLCWSLAWGARGRDATSFAASRKEMASFARQHWHCLLEKEDLGVVGRLCVRLTTCSGWWAIAATRGLNCARRVFR